MNKGVIGVLSFLGGAIAGVAGAWIFLEKQYRKKTDEVIQRVNETAWKNEEKEEENKEVRSKKEEERETIPQPKIEVVEENTMKLENSLQKQAAKIAREKPDIINYNKMITELEYKPTNDEEDEEYDRFPYLITKDKIPFGEKTDPEGNPYTVTTLIYYDDGVVADTAYEIIDDVNDVIGTDSLGHFGDFPNHDSIYVRNDRLRTDFEVCMSALSWEGDILQRMPYLRGI